MSSRVAHVQRSRTGCDSADKTKSSPGRVAESIRATYHCVTWLLKNCLDCRLLLTTKKSRSLRCGATYDLRTDKKIPAGERNTPAPATLCIFVQKRHELRVSHDRQTQIPQQSAILCGMVWKHAKLPVTVLNGTKSKLGTCTTHASYYCGIWPKPENCRENGRSFGAHPRTVGRDDVDTLRRPHGASQGRIPRREIVIIQPQSIIPLL